MWNTRNIVHGGYTIQVHAFTRNKNTNKTEKYVFMSTKSDSHSNECLQKSLRESRSSLELLLKPFAVLRQHEVCWTHITLITRIIIGEFRDTEKLFLFSYCFWISNLSSYTQRLISFILKPFTMRLSRIYNLKRNGILEPTIAAMASRNTTFFDILLYFPLNRRFYHIL